jgi:hypothetical protein
VGGRGVRSIAVFLSRRGLIPGYNNTTHGKAS